MRNDLEAAAASTFPDLQPIKDEIVAAGALAAQFLFDYASSYVCTRASWTTGGAGCAVISAAERGPAAGATDVAADPRTVREAPGGLRIAVPGSVPPRRARRQAQMSS